MILEFISSRSCFHYLYKSYEEALTKEKKTLIDLNAVTQQLKAIDSRIKEATEKHNQFLKELGLELLP